MLRQLCVALLLAYLCERVTSVHVYNVSESSDNEDKNRTLQIQMSLDEDDFGGGDWFMKQPVIPISVASSSYIRDPKCRNQSRIFLRQLRNFTLWAVEMFDAAPKLPVGTLSGNKYQMGQYDECVGISVDLGEGRGGSLKGQYCLAEIKVEFPKPSTADPHTLEYDPMTSAWNKIKYGNDPAKYRRDVIYWALCVPNSCTAEEMNYVLKHELKKIGDPYGVTFITKLDDKMCHTLKPAKPLTTGAIAYLIVLALLIGILVVSTAYDIAFSDNISEKESSVLGKKIPSLLDKVLLAFSVRQNLKKLVTVKEFQPAIDASHGSRFLFMLLIIFGHRLYSFSAHPMFNVDIEERFFRNVPSIMVANGLLIVDAYFALAGIMLTYVLLSHLHKRNGVNLALPIIVRFFRLTPSYMLVVFFQATIMPYMGSGPFWDSVVGLEQKNCANNWWTNLLYINNYVKTEEMCMFQSWYVSADFHLYIISLFLVYCIWRWPCLGYTMLGIFTIFSLLIPFAIIYLTKAQALLQPYPQYLHDVRDLWYYRAIYIPTHNRAAPYFIGVICGSAIFKLRNCTYKIPKLPSHIIYLGCWGFGVGMFFSGYVFFIPGRPYNVLEAALYGSLHRLGLAFGISVVFIIMTFGQIDIHKRIFSSKVFVVLSRLTYGAYLVHTMGHIYDQGSLRFPRALTEQLALWMVMGDFLFAFLVSLFLLLLVECPFRNLEKIIFGNT